MRKLLTLALCAISSIAAANDDTQVAVLANNQGVEQCYEALQHVSSFYIKDAAHGTHAVWNSDNADTRLFASLSSRRYSDGNSHIEINASPTTAGTCDISFTETYALPSRCTRVQNETFSGWGYTGMLDERTIVLENEAGNTNMYLTPQGEDGSFCLVSRREIIFGTAE